MDRGGDARADRDRGGQMKADARQGATERGRELGVSSDTEETPWQRHARARARRAAHADRRDRGGARARRLLGRPLLRRARQPDGGATAAARQRRDPGLARRASASTSASSRPMAAPMTTPSSRRRSAPTVDRLVAASERPDIALQGDDPQFARRQRLRAADRPALRDARAAGARQRHLRARLGALARDGARDRAPRRDPRGPGAPGLAQQRRRQRRAERPAGRRARARALEDQLATFSRAQEFEADGIGVGIAARAGYDPFGAARFLTSMGRNADLRAGGSGTEVRSPDFLSSHPATPERVKNAQSERAAVFRARRRRARPQRLSRQPRRPGLRRGPDRRLCARPPLPASQARLHLHGAGRLHAGEHRPGGARREGRRQPGAAARRRAGAGGAEPRPTISAPAGSRMSIRARSRSSPSAACRPRPRAAKGDQWSFRLYAVRFNGEVYRFIFAAKTRTPEIERAFRDSVATFRRLSLTEAQQAKPLRSRS